MSHDEEKRWKEYVAQTKASPARPLLVKATSYLNGKDYALDLGAGALNESTFLLSIGFEHVIAVDKIAVAQEIADTLPQDRFEYVISSFEDLSMPKNKYDLISAQYALPFVTSRTVLQTILKGILLALKDGGVFTGQFFGIHDEWNVRDSGMTFHTKEEAMHDLANLHVFEFKEEERDESTVAGAMKHWHLFHFIARK